MESNELRQWMNGILMRLDKMIQLLEIEDEEMIEKEEQGGKTIKQKPIDE